MIDNTTEHFAGKPILSRPPLANNPWFLAFGLRPSLIFHHGVFCGTFPKNPDPSLDTFRRAAIYLADNKAEKTKESFQENADTWADNYNYYFGFGGMYQNTIYDAYKKFNSDFILINSLIQDQYLSGTSKGFFRQLP